jgi:hypothetical protein
MFLCFFFGSFLGPSLCSRVHKLEEGQDERLAVQDSSESDGVATGGACGGLDHVVTRELGPGFLRKSFRKASSQPRRESSPRASLTGVQPIRANFVSNTIDLRRLD